MERNMKVQDKDLNKFVDVCDRRWIADNRPCYWPRPDPGVFTPGKGYKSRGNNTLNTLKHSEEYICGTRAIHGCPDEY
jgi:hypothetical protein